MPEVYSRRSIEAQAMELGRKIPGSSISRLNETMLISIRAPNPKKVLQDQSRFVWQNPGTVIDRNRFPVNTKDEVWRLNEVSRAEQINWTLLKTASDVKDSMKAYAAHVIETRATQTAAVKPGIQKSWQSESPQATHRVTSG